VLVAAAFAPHPPAIVPELAAGAATDLDDLRAACDEAVARMLTAGPDRVAVVGAGPPARWGNADAGTFAGYGIPLTVPLTGTGPGPVTGPVTGSGSAPVNRPVTGPVEPGPAEDPEADPGSRRAWLPLSVTVGAWLLARAGYAGPRHAVSVPAEAADPELAGWADAVDTGERIGLLVMGDGSARRSPAAPGYLDPRAAGFDAAVAAALRAGDPAGLRALDPALGAHLLAAGVSAWRLAGLLAADSRHRAELLYDDAPFGVGYLVAVWLA
jgi:hypothetical protein